MSFKWREKLYYSWSFFLFFVTELRALGAGGCWEQSPVSYLLRYLPSPTFTFIRLYWFTQWVSLWQFQESSVTGLWILIGKVLKHNQKPNLNQPTNQPSQNHVPNGKLYFSVRFPSRRKLGRAASRRLEKLNFELFCWLFVGLVFFNGYCEHNKGKFSIYGDQVL